MRYLILAAGVGKRMGSALAGLPKCMIDIDGEPLIARLLRQIRQFDAAPEIHVLLGYRSETIAPLLEGCRIILNPFFDITGINASLWFARESFDRALLFMHGDLVLSDELAQALFTAPEASLVTYDSNVMDPREINIRAEGGRVTRFGVNFTGYSGAYAGAIKLSAHAARLFADTLEQRIRRGFNEPRTYYFFVMRRLIAHPDVMLAPFDFAPYRWQEIDYARDIAAARLCVGAEGSGMPDGSFADSTLGPRAGSTDCVVLDAGTPPVDPRAFAAAIRLVLAGQSGELARDRNGICYRVDLARGDGSSRSAILKIPRPGPQRTNPETTFAWEARILASLPAAGIPGAPALLGRVAHGDTHFLFLEDVPGNHPDPRVHPLDARHLRALLEHFHAMDIRGLMHYDLKFANILIDGAQAGFIDYEFARFRSHLNAYAPDSDAFCADFNVSINPFFPARSNVANFEFRALDRYLRDAAAEPATADALLNDWLRGKSGYHRQMAAFLARLRDTSAELMAITSGIPAAEARARLGAAAEFEALLANLLAQPGVAVSRVERQLMAYRCAVFERHAVEAARLRAIIQAGIGAARARAATLPEAYCRAIARVLELVGRSVEDAPG